VNDDSREINFLTEPLLTGANIVAKYLPDKVYKNGYVICIISLLASYIGKLTFYSLFSALIVLTLSSSMMFDFQLIYGSSGHHRHSNRDADQNPTNSLPSIAICCGWGDKIAGGQLTYSIAGGDQPSRQAVVDAMNEWASRINGLQLTQISNSGDSDISVNFQAAGGQTKSHSDGIGSVVGRGHFFSEILGETKIDPRGGLINKAQITLARTGIGSPLDAAQIRQIAAHEIGHALGLGHANFVGDIMAPAVNYQVNSVSKCDINAVLIANNWKLEESSNLAQPNHSDHISCA
jgi:hypothetical protein